LSGFGLGQLVIEAAVDVAGAFVIDDEAPSGLSVAAGVSSVLGCVATGVRRSD